LVESFTPFLFFPHLFQKGPCHGAKLYTHNANPSAKIKVLLHQNENTFLVLVSSILQGVDALLHAALSYFIKLGKLVLGMDNVSILIELQCKF